MTHGTKTATKMTEQFGVVIASIAGWGFAAIFGTITVGLFLLREWLKNVEYGEPENEDD